MRGGQHRRDRCRPAHRRRLKSESRSAENYLSMWLKRRSPRRLGALFATGLLSATCFAGASLWGGSVARASTPFPPAPSTVPGGVSGPALSSVNQVCGVPAPGVTSLLGPRRALPGDPLTPLVQPAGGLRNFAVSSARLVVNTGSSIMEYSLNGQLTGSFSLPSAFSSFSSGVTAPLLLPGGEIVMASYYGKKVDWFSTDGAVLSSVDPDDGNPTGIFEVMDRSRDMDVAVSVRDEQRSVLLNADGSRIGTFPLVDDSGFVTTEPNGDLLYGAQGYVTEWNPTATKVITEFGSSDLYGRGSHTGGPYHFYYQGQAIAGPDGAIYTTDPNDTIEETSASGLLEAATTLNGSLSLAGSNAYLVGGELYLQTGTPFSDEDGISVLSLSDLDSFLAAPKTPLDTLGWGAGLATKVAGNYFAPGVRPRLFVQLSSPWTSAPKLELSYAVENAAQVNSTGLSAVRTVTLPRSSRALASVPLPLAKSDLLPGPYEVRAFLYEGTSPRRLIGSTCLPYTVGAAGDHLDLRGLPAGLGAGGPSDLRGVTLNSQLGLDGLRGRPIDWHDFLPDCNLEDPVTSSCGPQAMTFTSAPLSYFKAAYAAEKDKISYWVQVSDGDPVSNALVENGWWRGDVAALVRYYSAAPPGCDDCAAVAAWEPWNEPNNSGFSSPSLYVSQVLQPFYTAVKASEPAATVIGGSTLGVPLSWWRGLIAAGGLRDLDVASIHPYPPDNDSWEEAGTTSQIQQLQKLLGPTQLWVTELGWWSNGNFDFVEQANIVARAMLWMRVLHIPVWSYFFDEGSWGNDGVSFSLVQTGDDGDDFVKPASLATMTSSYLLGRRSFLAMSPTRVPDVYEADFSTADGSALSAVWSDDLLADEEVSLTDARHKTAVLTVESQYGATRRVRVGNGRPYRLSISGEVTYLLYPSGTQISVQPAEPYGPNLALTSAGATASASSGDAALAISGDQSGAGWQSAPGDEHPWFTVHLASPHLVNRVILDTQSVGSTATGLRSFTVSVQSPSGEWTQVASVKNEFADHELQVAFPGRMVDAVKVAVEEVNYGGYLGGAVPGFWPRSDPGTACIHSIGVYRGSVASRS